ncbi:MAG: hypothetical protein L6R36_009112 [Xanthoria steineri]|nr:MAG: hypothetical protein L6R36_009112 [Xanthoria steineri]
MYHLLTTLSLLTLLPLTILAAPAPAPQLELPKGPAVYYIMGTKSTLRGGRVISSEKSGHWIQKDFAVTVKGDTLDAANVLCTGKLAWEGTDDGNDEALNKAQTAQLACSDGQVHVDVTTDAGEGAAETYGVKDRNFFRLRIWDFHGDGA